MRWRFKIEQDGIKVAGGGAPDIDAAWRELTHYVAQYAQDGPVKITLTASTPDPLDDEYGPIIKRKGNTSDGARRGWASRRARTQQ